MRTCVIYTRVSTEMQVDGYSLDAQVQVLERYAELKDMKIIERYQDAGKSGKDIKGRPDFQRMLMDIKSHTIDVDYVLVFKLSRFGRSAFDTLKSLEILKQNEVALICTEDNIDTSSTMGKLILTILACISEMERENILVQTMEGRKEKARQGKWNGGHAPYGYMIGEDDVLLIDEEEGKIVKEIFSLYVKTDWGFGKIAKFLNNEGIKKSTHEHKNKLTTWSGDSIKKMIDNEIYSGLMPYGKRTIKKINGEEKRVFAENYMLEKGQHEAIIPMEMWKKAQRKREKTKGKREKEVGIGRESLLTGILKCPKCGSPMYMSRGRKNDKNILFYYKCGRKTKVTGHECSYTRQIRQEEIDSQVYEAIVKMLDYGQFEEEICKEMREGEDLERILEQKERVEKVIKTTRNSKKVLEQEMDSLAFDVPHYERKRQDMQRRLEKLYDQEAKQEEILEGIQRKLKNIKTKEEMMETVHTALKNFSRLYDKLSDSKKKSFYKLLIEKIEIYQEPRENGQWLKRIRFKFPLSLENQENIEFAQEYGNTDTLQIELDVPKLDIIRKKSATYKEIGEFIKEKYGVSVHSGYIAEVKRKCGLDMRKNYNIPKKNVEKKHCTPEKEKYIMEALKHFGMIEK